MADRLLLEAGTDGYLKEDGTGVLLLDRYVELNSPAEGASTGDLPVLEFTGYDPQGDSVRFQVQIHTADTFGGTIDTYNESNADTGLNRTANGGIGQSFTGDGSFATGAKLQLSYAVAATGTATIKLYAHSGTFGTSSVPTGAALATATFDLATLTSTPTVYEFTFATPFQTVAGTNYCLAFEVPVGATGTPRIDYDSVGTHAGNVASYSSGGAWGATAASDMVFHVLGGPLLDKTSGTDAGFLNTVSGGDTDPFNSGEKVSFTVQAGDELADDTWYWRVRGKDPTGADTWSDWSETRSFASTANANVTVTPGVASLVSATFIPTVTASNHQSVTPGVVALALTAFAPTVTASDHQSVTPTTAVLTTAVFAPTVAVTDHQRVVPSTASLVTSAFAPTVSTPQTVTPGVASLTLAPFAPTVTATDHQSVTPSTAALVTTSFAPTVAVSDHQRVTPETAVLVTAQFAPTVSTTEHVSVVPVTGALTLSTFAPSVSATAHQTVTPDTASLTTATFEPTVSATAHQTVVPDTASLVLTASAPIVTVGDEQVVVPTNASLTLTTFAPVVSASDPQLVVPGTGALTLSTFAPTVTGTDHRSVTPDTAALTLSPFAPTVAATADETVIPTTAGLTLTTFAPVVTTGAGLTVMPDTASLVLTGFAPTVTADEVVQPEPPAGAARVAFAGRRIPRRFVPNPVLVRPRPASLVLTPYAPIVFRRPDPVAEEALLLALI